MEGMRLSSVSLRAGMTYVCAVAGCGCTLAGLLYLPVGFMRSVEEEEAAAAPAGVGEQGEKGRAHGQDKQSNAAAAGSHPGGSSTHVDGDLDSHTGRRCSHANGGLDSHAANGDLDSHAGRRSFRVNGDLDSHLAAVKKDMGQRILSRLLGKDG